jgi:hypothetical protein
MLKIPIVDNEFATSWCYPSKKLIHHQFHKFCCGDNFRNIMIRDAEAFEEHKCTKWLSDDRKVGLIPPDDVDWGRIHWTPRVIKAGWKYFAMVLPEKVIGQMVHTAIVNEFAELGVEAQIFGTPEEGMAWLDSKSAAFRLNQTLNPKEL